MKILAPLVLLCTLNYHSSLASEDGFHGIISPTNQKIYGQALEAIFTMGFRLQDILNMSTEQNLVVSPLSTAAIIGQLMIGADGEFREDLHDLLGLPPSSASFNVTYFGKERNESLILPYATFHMQLAILIKNLRQRKPGEEFILNLANAMFHNSDIDLRTVFTSSLNKMYDADIVPLDFTKDTTRIINQWASDRTNGLIKSFLSSPPPSSTASMFLNSIYFYAEWETPFSDALNHMDTFTVSPSHNVSVLYMVGKMEDVPYVETKHYKLVCLPYKNRELGMYIFLPNIHHEHKYDIRKFLASLDPKEIVDSLSNMKNRSVDVKMPKLHLTNTISLLKPLQKYATYKKIEDNRTRQRNGNSLDNLVNQLKQYQNFTRPAYTDIYLDNAARGVNLKVSDIFQQTIFSVNEKGTEAASVTAGTTFYEGGSKSLFLGRPFSFFIRHEETQATIYWGTITNPDKH
ncbi:serine protease inhibitor 42Dd-like [Diabrotica undecimpunctata]|uniref:serine protease inhibitor 42Dd-like n=1 Tax=Diabrotica undecimpunctata TaxID=50387 RepID=UPI003B637264